MANTVPTGSENTPKATSIREREANALLRRQLSSHSSGIYSNAQLQRKIRDEQKRLPELTEKSIPDETVEYLVQAQINDLIDAANLTVIQEIIYRLYISGTEVRYIATACGRKSKTIFKQLKVIKRKITAAHEEGIYAGWYEVYLSEINRGR